MNDMPVFGPSKANTQTALEDIAIETGVPIEVLFASGERAGAQSPDEFLSAARQSAQTLAPRFQAGEDPMAIIGELFGPEAQGSFGDYATDVRAALYGTETVQEANVSEIEEGGFLGTVKRRGQQFIRGAAEPFAALPEAKAIAQSQVDGQDTAAEDLEGFDRGQRLRDSVSDTFGAPNPEDKSFWAMVAEGAGNLVGMGGASLAAGVAGTFAGGPVGGAVAGFGTGGALGSAMTSSQLYREAVDAGATEDVAQKAANWGFAIGATEIVPIARAFKYLPASVRGRIGNGVMKRFTDIAQSAGEETAQEYLATVASNMVAQQLYDPDRGWTEGATEGALVGAVLGGGAGAIGAGVDSYRNRPQPIPDTGNEEGAVPPGAGPDAGTVPPVMGDRSPPEQEEPTPMGGALNDLDQSAPAPMTDATARAPQPAFANYQPEQPVSVRLVDPETGEIGDPINATFVGEDPAAGYASFRSEDGTALEVDINQINSGMVLVAPAATTGTMPGNVPAQEPAAPAFNAPIPEGVDTDAFVERVAIRQADGMSEQDAYQITLQEALNSMQQDVGTIAGDVAERQRQAQEDASRIDEAMFTDGDGQPVIFPTMGIAKQRVGAGFMIEPFGGGFIGVRKQGEEANAESTQVDVPDGLGSDGIALPVGGADAARAASDPQPAIQGGASAPDGQPVPAVEQDSVDATGATDADAALSEAEGGEVSELLGQARANIERKDKLTADLANSGAPVRFIDASGQRAIAGPDMSKEGGFRLTRLGADGVPNGHSEFSSLGGAIRAALDENMEPEASNETTETAPADQNPVKKNDVPEQVVTGEGSETARTDQETDPKRKAVADAIAAGEVTHTTRKGKELTGYVVKGFKPADMKDVDPYGFAKDGGAFIRTARANEFLGSESDQNTSAASEVRKKAVADINKAVTAENKDGSNTYLSGPITVELDDFGLGDVEITVTNTRSQFKGRAKEIRENTQRFNFKDIRDDLGDTAFNEISRFQSGAESPSASTAPDAESFPSPYGPGKVSEVDYPNRQLNMRKARADAPVNGIGDNSDMSLGNIALANAREGDVLPGVGTVLKVTAKQIQITKPDGNVMRLSDGSEKLTGLARDMGALIASSANLRDEQLGSLMEMIERDPALVYRDGVPMLFDDPAEQANRGQRGGRQRIGQPLTPAKQDVDQAAAEADPNPTDAQKEAGNYKKGHVIWNGMNLTIENAKGSERSGTDQDGETWSVTMPAHYGYFKMTEGADGEHVDFYMGEAPDADYVMWIDQADANTGKFDEHKIMVGFPSRGAALAAYRGGFSDGRADERIGGIFEGNVAQLKAWLESTLDSNFDSTKPVNGKLDFPFKKPADAKKPERKRPPIGSPGYTLIDAMNDLKEMVEQEAAQGTITDARLGARIDRQRALVKKMQAEADALAADVAKDDAKPKSEKLDDFGEKLGGARKDAYEARRKLIESMNEIDFDEIDMSTMGLSDILPMPDFVKLASDGDVPIDGLYMIAMIRSALPKKPTVSQGSWNMQEWRQAVRKAHTNTKAILSGDYDLAAMVADNSEYGEAFGRSGGNSNGVNMKVMLKENPEYLTDVLQPFFARIDPENMMEVAGNIAIGEQFEYVRDPDTNRQMKEKTGKLELNASGSVRRAPWRGRRVAKTMQEAAELANDWAAQRRTAMAEARKNGSENFEFGFHIRKARGTPTAYIYARKPKLHSMMTFASSEDARKFLNSEDGKATLQEMAGELRAGFEERRRDNAERVGPDWRKGKDIAPKKFMEVFGFRGGEFGNYVTGKERTAFVNATYDSLMDLAAILGVPPKTLSLDGKLGIGFGSRGTGGRNPAAAHYEPGAVVINLTRMNGAGSLAHEWFHALDNYLAKQDAEGADGGYGTKALATKPNAKNVRNDFMTGRHRRYSNDGGMPRSVYDAFVALRAEFAKSGYLGRMEKYDKFKSAPYYSDPIEMGARSFEAWVLTNLKDRSLSHDFLVNVFKDDGGALPNIQERGTIFPVFNQIMDELKSLDQFKGGDAPSFPALPEGSIVGPVRPGHTFEGSDGIYEVTDVEEKDGETRVTFREPNATKGMTVRLAKFYAMRAEEMYAATPEGKAEAAQAAVEAQVRADALAQRQEARDKSNELVRQFETETGQRLETSNLEYGYFNGDNGNPATFMMDKIRNDGWEVWMDGRSVSFGIKGVTSYSKLHQNIFKFGQWAKQIVDAEKARDAAEAKADNSYESAFDAAFSEEFGPNAKDPSPENVDGGNRGIGDGEPQPDDAVPTEDGATETGGEPEGEANEPTPETKPTFVQDDEKPAVKTSLTDAKDSLKEGLKESMTALNTLFGSDMNRMNSGLSFDQETYKKAVPHFKKAYRAYASAATSLVDAFGGMIRFMVEQGLDASAIGNMRPYFIQFMKDVDTKAINVWAEEETAMSGEVQTMADAFEKALADGTKFKTINAARRMAAEALDRKLTDADYKTVEEAMELAVVRTSRAIVAKGESKAKTFDALEALYQSQPLLAQRTNDSMRRQAYSTPAPLAYVASELAGIDSNTTVYEPTAGNGMLLLAADPKLSTANELDVDRAARLRDALGQDATITIGSALDVDGPTEVDVVIQNPPFGKLLVQDSDKATQFSVPYGADGTTTEIDHAIVAKTLESMTDDGRAVLIVGGHQGDADTRKSKYRGKPRAFWNWLYDNYGVTEHFTVSGDLYKRQGAGWPVDVVVIEGRQASTKALPMAEAPTLYDAWDQLKERIDGTNSTLDARGSKRAGGDGQGQPGPDTDVGPLSVEAGSPTGANDGAGATGGSNTGGNTGRGGGASTGALGGDGQAGTNPRNDSQQQREPDGPDRTAVAGGDPATDGSTGVGPEVVQRSDAGSVGGGSSSVTPKKRVNTEEATDLQVQYDPRSTADFAVGTLVPKNMQDAMTSALDAIAAEVGDIDQFVADELGYDVTRMLSGDGNAPGYFSAEQVDALALSIYNIKKGGGFIIGDQTGVGKGRVVAAMMRWAERNNRVPVFLTARAGLFNAMVTDMRDIGWEGDITADTFVTNSDLRGKDALALDSGGVLKAMTPKPYKAAMAELATGKTPDGIKRIFTTYSQMQSVKGAETPRRNMFRAIAPNALFILDESHLAGGAAKSERMQEDDDLSRAKFIRDILDQSTGAFFSSATFAKSPTVMSLYAKTDLRLAVADIENLAGVIEQGGVPMQQVASNMLVQSGQYVRRERSYAGVKFNTTPYKTNMVAAKAGTQAIRSVFDLDRDVMQDVREAFIEELMSEGNGGAIDGAVGEQSATSINFASVMHNVVGQFITAIKADAAAARVIEIIESGRKPIIALSNTNEAIISDFVGDAKEGDDVGEVPFNTILMRYADRLRRITITDKDTDKKRRIVMTDADIRRIGGEKALQQFKETRAAIEKMDLTGIPGSPLDHIMDKVVAAGYQMGEITGRKTSVRNGKVSLREPSAAEKNRTMRAYNTGEIEALIINKSGAEGFSLHATGKNGNDGKPRSMIVLQPDADINVFMQLIGRIHRTGQIHLPEYDIAISELAVEKRPAAVLMRKMASLSANTTANKDSVVSLDAVDFMNKYGDRVMREYLDENPDIACAMDMESLLSSSNEDGERQELSGGDYAAKATGRMAILDPAVAESAFKDIEGAYVALIEELDRAGTNDLEAKTIDLDAKTKSATNLTAGVPESSSAFAAPARFEIADVKTTGNPMSSKEVMEAVKDAWGNGDIRSWRQNMATEIRKWAGPLQARFDGAVEEKQSELKSAQNEKLRERITIAIADLQDRRAKVQAQVASVIEQLTDYAPGRPLVMVNRDDPDVRHNGVVVGVDWERAQENPNAKSKIMVRIAIAAPEREVRLSLSSLTSQSGPYDVTFFNNLQNTVEMFDSVPREMREDRGIITGNLLAGYEKFPKGRIVMFTRNDGTTESGILMPRNFNLAVELEKAPVPLGTASDVMKFIEKDQSQGGGYSYYATAGSVDGVVSVTRNSRGFYVITVRAKGGKKYAEHSIIAKEFGQMTKRGSREYTQVVYDEAQVERVIAAYIKDLRASFQAESNKGFAREVMGIEMPDTSVAEVKASMSKRADRQTRPFESEAQARRDLDQIADEIGAEIGRTTGRKVSFHVNETHYNFGKGYEALDGYFLDGVIGVSAMSPVGPLGVARHEVIHALRSRDLFGGEAGAFTKEEWRTLVRAARKNKRLRDQVDRLYEGKSESIKIEEVVAEMYREWSDGRDAGLSDAEQSAMQTLKRVLDAIINVLRGNGMQTAADVFERVRLGEVGGRGPDGSSASFDGDPVANPELMASISKMWSDKPTSRTDASLDKKEASFVSNLITNAMASNDRMNVLGLVPGEVLFRDLGKALPSAAKWVSRMRKMTSERQEMHAESDKLAQEWQGAYVKDKENGRKLHDLMHEATIAGVDPSIRFVAPKRRADMSQKDYRTAVENAKAAYGDLKQKYAALPENMKAIFGKARDAYRKFDDDLMNAMVDSVAKAMDLQASRLKASYEAELQQIKDDGLEGDARDFARKKARSRYNQDVKMLEFSRNARIRKMRLTYEANRIDGPYFPLMRFGQFFVAARDKKGKLVHFERATTVGVQQRIEADMKSEGFTVETGVIKPEDNMSRFVDPNFVADVQDLLGEVGDNGEVLDAIYQRYLETLPSFSIRKANIHRKGVPGFDKDAIKAFGSKMFHGAHQLARLRHSMDLTRHIEDARREAKDAPNPTRAGAIVNEMQKRHDWSMNPQGARWSAWATSASFIWYLGLTPGAAVVNITQTTVVGIPILAAGIKGGSVAKAAKALSGALADFTAGLAKGDAEWSRGALTSGRLSDDERKALQAAYNSGALDKSQAHDIAAIGDSGVEYSAVREKAMRPIAFLFHHAERLNREVTFLAAYRMSKESGLDTDQATKQAGNLTWDTHFNYENWSRPRFMQGDVARVAFVFRQFQVNMLYRLFRDSHQALKGESPEVRKQARAQLIGMTGSMMLHAGITGTWGYALMMLLAGMFFDGGKDEAEEELKSAVVSMFGTGAGGMILKGVPGTLTGADLSSRIGMPELWFRSPDRQMEGKEAYNYWVEQLLGAFPAIGASIFRGASMVGDGEVWRGMELMVPKAVRDQMRFMRYLNEGVTTYKGDPLMDNVSAHDAIVQAIGFSPARVSERYEQNRRMMNMQMGIQDERRRILSDVTRYLREGKEISPRARSKMQEFNAKYPTYPITGDTIRLSLSARLRASQQINGGIRLNAKLEGLLRSGMAPSLYD